MDVRRVGSESYADGVFGEPLVLASWEHEHEREQAGATFGHGGTAAAGQQQHGGGGAPPAAARGRADGSRADGDAKDNAGRAQGQFSDDEGQLSDDDEGRLSDAPGGAKGDERSSDEPLRTVRFVDPTDDDDEDGEQAFDGLAEELAVESLPGDPGGWGLLISFHNLVVRVRAQASSPASNARRRGPCSSCLPRSLCCVASTKEDGSPYYRTLLDGCSGYFPPGMVTGMLGPSGSGKTTLLDAIARRGTAWWQLRDQPGAVRYDGRSAADHPHRGCAVAYCEQFDSLPGDLTIGELLEYSAYMRLPHLDAAARKRVVDGVAEQLGLIGRVRNARIGTASNKAASGGQRKRAAIAQSLLARPRALLLDEPCSGLDSTTSRKLMHVFASLAAKPYGTTVVATLHTPSEEEFGMLDRLLLMVDGAVVYLGPTESALPFLYCGAPRNAMRAAHEQHGGAPPPAAAKEDEAPTVPASETILDILSGVLEVSPHGSHLVILSPSSQSSSPGRWDHTVKLDEVLIDDGESTTASSAASVAAASVNGGSLTQRDLVGPALVSPCASPPERPQEELTERRELRGAARKKADPTTAMPTCGAPSSGASALTARRIAMAARWVESDECADQAAQCAVYDKGTRRYRRRHGVPPPQHLDGDSDGVVLLHADGGGGSTLHEIKGLFYWRGAATLRDRSFFPSRILPRLIAALVIISVVHNVPDDTFAGWTQRQAILFLCVVSISMTMMDAAPFVFDNRAVYWRERDDGIYRSRSYFMYLLLLEMLPAAVHVTIFDLVLYFAIPFRMVTDPGTIMHPFGYFFVLTYTLGWVAVAFAYLMASFASTMRNASAMMGVALMVCGMTSGFFVTKPEMPQGWAWFVYLNPLYFALRGLYKNEFVHYGAELCISIPSCFLGNECIAEYAALQQRAELLSATANVNSGATFEFPFSEEPFATMFQNAEIRAASSTNPSTCLAVTGCAFLESMYGSTLFHWRVHHTQTMFPGLCAV